MGVNLVNIKLLQSFKTLRNILTQVCKLYKFETHVKPQVQN